MISVPHAGRDYPAWLLAMSASGPAALHALEDPLVDELVAGAVRRGVGAVVARAPRAAVDCNRAEDEVDPSVVTGSAVRLTPRARGGLGVVPARTAAHGQLWRRPIDRDQLEERLEQVHRPFHRAIELQLEALLDRFGCALLLDCHSMPPPGFGVPPVVLGDLHGRSAAGWVTHEAVRIVAAAGWTVRLNDPFAGGYVIDRHGNPARGVHALQVEIDRRCYLEPSGRAPGGRFAEVSRLIEQLGERLGRSLLERGLPEAAE